MDEILKRENWSEIVERNSSAQGVVTFASFVGVGYLNERYRGVFFSVFKCCKFPFPRSGHLGSFRSKNVFSGTTKLFVFHWIWDILRGK